MFKICKIFIILLTSKSVSPAYIAGLTRSKVLHENVLGKIKIVFWSTPAFQKVSEIPFMVGLTPYPCGGSFYAPFP